MDSSNPPPLTPRQPSPAAASAWRPALDAPVVLDRAVVTGTEGLTLADVKEEVLKGGRFVIHTYVFSVLVMSFRRSSGIRFLRSGQDGAGHAFGYSLLSLLVGPWGFPWGLIWTPACIFTNLSGGKDVTHPVLQAFLGEEDAAHTMASRRKHSAGWGMILLRTMFIAAPLALIAPLFFGAVASNAMERKTAQSPGFAQFTAAHNVTSHSAPGGNTPAAREAAKKIADGMKQFLDESVTHSGTKTPPSHACGVWCEIRDDRCIVIMRVPDLRHYDSKAQGILATAAWLDSLANLQDVDGIRPGSMLHVGLRGDVLYDSVMTGRLTDDIKAKPETKLGSSEGRAKLIEWFTPQASKSPEKAVAGPSAKTTT